MSNGFFDDSSRLITLSNFKDRTRKQKTSILGKKSNLEIFANFFLGGWGPGRNFRTLSFYVAFPTPPPKRKRNQTNLAPFLVLSYMFLISQLSLKKRFCLHNYLNANLLFLFCFVFFYSASAENVHRSSPGSIKQLFNRKFGQGEAGTACR